jgi:hypothetical protein
MRRALGLLAKAGPFLIIAGLIGAVFAVKLEPVVHAVAEPPLAPRDLFLGAAAPADGVLWLAGSEGKIVRSDDGGRSWRVQRSGTTGMLQAIAAWSPAEAVAVGADGAVLATRDGGGTWRPIRLPIGKPHRLLAAALDGAGRLWVAGEMGSTASPSPTPPPAGWWASSAKPAPPPTAAAPGRPWRRHRAA